MKIDIRDPAEFKRLLEALAGELIDARDHFRLHQSLAAAIPDYQVEFNQSAGFWTLTLNAHMDAVLLRLCKVYDLSKDKPNLNLRNFLDTIEANLHLFDEPNFRERLKENPFVDSLAQDPRTPDVIQLREDRRSVTAADPVVKKLMNWRHHYVAHRSRTAALDLQLFTTQNPLSFPEIEALITNGLAIVNCYSANDFQTAPAGCLAGKVCYTPQGTFYALSIGQTSSFTGLNLTHSYNSRLQPNEFKASSSGGNAVDITYGFVDPVTTHNSGHVYSVTNNLDSTRSQTFTYDQLNRITSALTTSTHASSPTHCWGETYSLDSWGNLQSIAATTNSNYTGCSQESGFSAAADGNNHLTGFSYDLSGNTQNDGTNSYTWDAESQLKTATGVTYAYDGDGRRVSKSSGKLYWYGSGGDILAETDASGNATAEYIFFGGKRLAMLPTGSDPIYYVEDLLGTSRVITNNTGVVCYDADFYPFGGERPYTNNCAQNNYKFEGKERDSETGNDDFGARYYTNRFGRWLSSDWSAVPVAIPYANLTNPQTLNLYAMAADDPESFADLDGHMEVAVPATAGGSFVLPSWGGINAAERAGDEVFGIINAQIQADQEKERQQQAQNQSQTQTQTQTQTEQKQLKPEDVSMAIQSAKEDKGSHAKIAVDFLNSLGTNWKLSGDTLRQALKDSKVNAHGLDKNVDSISRTGK
jgi:RHS repeat-associated protein